MDGKTNKKELKKILLSSFSHRKLQNIKVRINHKKNEFYWIQHQNELFSFAGLIKILDRSLVLKQTWKRRKSSFFAWKLGFIHLLTFNFTLIPVWVFFKKKKWIIKLFHIPASLFQNLLNKSLENFSSKSTSFLTNQDELLICKGKFRIEGWMKLFFTYYWYLLRPWKNWIMSPKKRSFQRVSLGERYNRFDLLAVIKFNFRGRLKIKKSKYQIISSKKDSSFFIVKTSWFHHHLSA